MKKVFMSLMVLAVVFVMAAPAMAVPKLKNIPTTMCFSVDMDGGEGYLRYLFIGFKNMKTIKVYGEPTKIFQAAGVTDTANGEMALTGSAYIIDRYSQEFTALLLTDYYDIQSIEIYWDVDDRTGGAYIYDTSVGEEMWYDFTLINCNNGEPILPVTTADES